MAVFDNVTYTYYSDTMGRSDIPDAATFNRLKLEEELFLRQLYNAGMLKERESNGIDKACCMMIEEAYKTERAQAGADNIDTAETISGYSHTMNAKAAEIAIEKNARSAAERKYKWLTLYCHVLNGVR